MKEKLSEIIFYSIVTGILCGMLWSLGGLPWQPLILIGIILICMIVWSVVRERDSGGPR